MSNPYRKVRIFHLTYKGHYMLNIPYPVKTLGYCYEEEQEMHTHVILETITPISKLDVIADLTPYLEIPCEIDVETGHRHIETVIGYHIGLGDKPRCEDLVMIIPFDFDIDEYIRLKVMHKPRGIFQNRSRNQILLTTNTKDLIDRGDIPLEKIILIDNCKAHYAKYRDDDREELDSYVPNPWGLHLPNDTDNKRCHYWIWSRESNRGKSTVAGQLVSKYRGICKTGSWNWWTIRRDCDFVVLDEYTGGLKYNELNSLCDGTYEFNCKNVQPFTLEKKPLIIVFSNKSISEVYPNMHHLVSSRFNEYELP